MTHDNNNLKHINKINHGMRKPIRTSELNFEKSNFEFDELQSRKIRRFIFLSEKNRQRYVYWKSRHKKKK